MGTITYRTVGQHVTIDQRGERGPKNDNSTDKSTEHILAYDILCHDPSRGYRIGICIYFVYAPANCCHRGNEINSHLLGCF